MTGDRPASRRHLALGAVTSTNSIALEAARAGDPGPLWITAESQSAGRGRRGRPWSSQEGNLYTSLLLIDPAPIDRLGQLPLVVAVGLRSGLLQLNGISADDLRIKWPNDLLLNGSKCVGILVESELTPDGRRSVVIGFGVNVAVCPDDAPYPVTTLARSGVKATVSEVFAAVACGIERSLDIWQQGTHFSRIREQWLAGAAGLGSPCRVNLPTQTLEGRFADLDLSGRLVLDMPDGSRTEVSAGDVFLLPREPATASP